jgi:hypothetical protein
MTRQKNFRTYTQLSNFIQATKIKIDSNLMVLISGLYLQGEKFHPSDYYGNHYLRDVLSLKSLPPLQDVERLITTGPVEVSNILKNKGLLANKDYSSFSDIAESLRSEHDQQLRQERCEVFTQHSLKDTVFSEIKEKGYTIQQGLFRPEFFEMLVCEFERIANHERGAGLAYLYGKSQSNQRLYSLFLKHSIFRKLLESKLLNSLLDKLFYRQTHHTRYGISSFAGHIIPSGGDEIPWHIDSVVPEPIPAWLMRFIVVIPLSDFTVDNGATEIIPYSHKWCRNVDTSDESAMESAIKLIAPKGSLIMWDGLCWHRSTRNISNSARPAIIISYAASFFREICGEENYVELLLKNVNDTLVTRSLSPLILDLIGYNRGLKFSANVNWDL